jgi:hypothetical protein
VHGGKVGEVGLLQKVKIQKGKIFD